MGIRCASWGPRTKGNPRRVRVKLVAQSEEGATTAE